MAPCGQGWETSRESLVYRSGGTVEYLRNSPEAEGHCVSEFRPSGGKQGLCVDMGDPDMR